MSGKKIKLQKEINDLKIRLARAIEIGKQFGSKLRKVQIAIDKAHVSAEKAKLYSLGLHKRYRRLLLMNSVDQVDLDMYLSNDENFDENDNPIKKESRN